MKEYTTLDIIRIIPLEREVRDTLLKEYASYDEDKKLYISKIVWPAFHSLADLLIESYTNKLEMEVAAGKLTIPENTTLADMVDDAVDADLEERKGGEKEEQQDISAIREQLKVLSEN